jgi:ribosomal protein S18 acetylase RimI-like enzyme
MTYLPPSNGISQIHLVAEGDARLEEIRKLFIEYVEWLGEDLSFQGFDEELASLPGLYAAPHGALFLSLRGKESAGCVAVRPIDHDVCEMKRLWVRPRFRGQSLGLRLASAAIDAAHRLGYATMRLDTLDRMHDALRLYRSLGFHYIPPYYDNPLPGAVYLQKSLVQ